MENVPVLIAAAMPAASDALEEALTKVHEIRIVGADVWEAETLRRAVRSFRPALLVTTPDCDVPDDVGLPCLTVPLDADPAAYVVEYLAASAEPVTPVAQPAAADPVPEPRPKPQSTPALNLPAPRRTVRLGFWGERGGVGTTTAALNTAQRLIARGFKVALCDATGRGDTFLWAGFKPQTQPSSTDQLPGLTFFPNLPSAEELQPFPAVVIDGGRKPRERNVQWVRVTAPLHEEAIARLVEPQC